MSRIISPIFWSVMALLCWSLTSSSKRKEGSERSSLARNIAGQLNTLTPPCRRWVQLRLSHLLCVRSFGGRHGATTRRDGQHYSRMRCLSQSLVDWGNGRTEHGRHRVFSPKRTILMSDVRSTCLHTKVYARREMMCSLSTKFGAGRSKALFASKWPSSQGGCAPRVDITSPPFGEQKRNLF